MNTVPWIRLYLSFFTHKKTMGLRRALGTVEPILRLWCWAAENAPSGDLGGLLVEDLEDAIGWKGEAGKAVVAMTDLGFLDKGEHGLSLHGWAEHSGAGIDALEHTRALTRARVKRHRDAQAATNDHNWNLKSQGKPALDLEPGILDQKDSTLYDVTRQCNASNALLNANVTRPGEERREEKKEKKESTGASPAADGPLQLSSPVLSAPPELPLLVFPCAASKTWALTEATRAEMAQAFPAIDVLAVARKALEWCKANPKKVKTAARMRSWLGTVWMGPAQDRPSEPVRQQTTFGGTRFPSTPISTGKTWTKAPPPKIAPVTTASERGWPVDASMPVDMSKMVAALADSKTSPYEKEGDDK
jgi:hypothetical protein